MSINESTLEARIDRVLATVFPSLKDVRIEHQKSFSIKFGHHTVSIDLKDPSRYTARAIFDILLTVDGKNIILLELKREGMALTDEDRDQGISYARLIDSMPPIVVVTNGNETNFYKTHTKEKINNASIDMEFISRMAQNSFDLALNDFKDAVGLLLNRDPDLFSKTVNQITEKKFGRLLGEIHDFSKPICLDLMFDRNIVEEVAALISGQVPLIGIIGPAFSGKTSILFQLYKKLSSERHYVLYINCSDHNYSILQQLANQFTELSRISVTTDKIREWLINSLGYSGGSKFVLLLDNFNEEIPEPIKNEVIELIDIFRGINHHTIYSIDEYNFNRIAFVENRRYKTIIGQESKILKLEQLDDQEFDLLQEYVFEQFRVSFELGAHRSAEYREPRILRHLINYHIGNEAVDQYIKIMAVPDLNLLRFISENATFTSQIHDHYKNISFCFLAEAENRKNDGDFNLIATGSGAISIETLERLFPDTTKALIKSATVVIKRLKSGLQIACPRIPELVAYHSIDLVKTRILNEKRSGTSVKEVAKSLVNIVTPLPYCDIVGVGVLLKIAAEDVDLFSGIVQELLKIPPRVEKVDAETKLRTLIGEDFLDVKENEMEFYSDPTPFAILSQLAGHPLKLLDNVHENEYAFHLYLIYTVGSIEHLITRGGVGQLQGLMPHVGYDFPSVGHIVSGREGIIEPIVQSILKCFREIPEQIELIYGRAFDENNFVLLWRVYLALRTMQNVVDERLAEMAGDFTDQFLEYFNQFMADLLTKDIQDQTEREKLKKSLLGFKL